MIKKFFLAAIIFSLFNIASYCQDMPYNRRYGLSFDIKTDISTIAYEETNFIKEIGLMTGFVFDLTSHSSNNLMFKSELKYSVGYVDYDGQTQSGTPLKLSSVPDVNYELRLLLGYDNYMGNTLITPYFGFGDRVLEDNLQLVNAGGYFRQANYLYYPLGIMYSSPIDQGTSFIAMIEYDDFAGGRQVSNLSDVKTTPKYPNIVNIQTEGFGYRWSAGIKGRSYAFDYSFELFYKYWQIPDSETEIFEYNGSLYGATEPNNTSGELGLSFIFYF